MRHATPAALDRLEPLLGEIRKLGALTERKRGLFHLGSRAFLHFHEDPAGLFADLRDGEGFARFKVDRPGERRTFLRALRTRLTAAAK